MRRNDVQVVWLSYFNSGKTRSEGRRVSKRIALDSPKLSELVSACRSLRLEPESFPDVRYCRSGWEKCGRVLVKSDLPKTETLHRIAEAMRRVRTKEKKRR